MRLSAANTDRQKWSLHATDFVASERLKCSAPGRSSSTNTCERVPHKKNGRSLTMAWNGRRANHDPCASRARADTKLASGCRADIRRDDDDDDLRDDRRPGQLTTGASARQRPPFARQGLFSPKSPRRLPIHPRPLRQNVFRRTASSSPSRDIAASAKPECLIGLDGRSAPAAYSPMTKRGASLRIAMLPNSARPPQY
jgi:hypothetical protein